MGIDPGSVVTGWGVVERQGERLIPIANGCVRAKDGETVPQRLGRIFAALTELIALHRPQEAAIEQVFVSHNVDSALKLGQARGAAIAALSNAGLPVSEYTPMQIKKSVVGYGKAEKGQVQEMIRVLLTLEKLPAQDAADALAVAVCHLHQTPSSQDPLQSPARGRGGARSWREWNPEKEANS